MSTLRLTTISNQSGSATVPSETVINGSAKAWVNFNGQGTVAIRASFNVTSITDNATGQYTVNFTTAMPNTNYAAVQNNDWYGLGYLDTYLTSSVKIYTINNDWSPRDVGTISIAVFR